MEMMVYAKEEIILNRQKLMDQITSHLNIFSSKPSFVALSMVVQLRQQLGYGVVKLIFTQQNHFGSKNYHYLIGMF